MIYRIYKKKIAKYPKQCILYLFLDCFFNVTPCINLINNVEFNNNQIFIKNNTKKLLLIINS